MILFAASALFLVDDKFLRPGNIKLALVSGYQQCHVFCMIQIF